MTYRLIFPVKDTKAARRIQNYSKIATHLTVKVLVDFKKIIATILIASQALATTVAVIDSGLDIEHTSLTSKLWENTKEILGEDGIDDDGNGLIDDKYGFNFLDDTHLLLDPNNQVEFKTDDYEYFKLQDRVTRTKAGLDNLSAEEIQNFNTDKRQGHAYDFAMLGHGTHVAGIIAKDNPNVKIMGIKKGNKVASVDKYKYDLLSYNIKNIAREDIKDLEETVLYLKSNNVRVANGSFGTPYEAVINRFLAMRAYRMSMSEIKYISKLYQKELLKKQEETLQLSKETLFVFAAGNSGYDNDSRIFTPANVNIDNALTVAATIDRDALPKFSCYGHKTVHVAAPGVGIISSVPGNYIMPMTGTSQAAPYVSRVASQIIMVNSALSSYEVKKILISTVDKKDYLKGKVSSGGIVNDQRAIAAAELSLTMSVDEAITEAVLITPDM